MTDKNSFCKFLDVTQRLLEIDDSIGKVLNVQTEGSVIDNLIDDILQFLCIEFKVEEREYLDIYEYCFTYDFGESEDQMIRYLGDTEWRITNEEELYEYLVARKEHEVLKI